MKPKYLYPRRRVERIQRLDEDRRDMMDVGDKSPDTAKWDQPQCVLTIEIISEDNWHRCGEHARGAKQEVRDCGGHTNDLREKREKSAVHSGTRE
jgi:hypothetical protein